MPFLPLVPYVMSPILGFATASRPVHDYFGDQDRVSGPIWGTEGRMSALEHLKADRALAVPTSAPFSSDPPLPSFLVLTPTPLPVGFPLSSSPLATLSQTNIGGCSPRASTIAPTSMVFSLDTSAPPSVRPEFSSAGLSSAVVSVSVDLSTGSLSDASVAMVGNHQLLWFLYPPLSLVPARM